MTDPDPDEAIQDLLDELDGLTEKKKVETARNDLAHSSTMAGDESLSNALDPIVEMINDRIDEFDAFAPTERPELDRLAIKSRVMRELQSTHSTLPGGSTLRTQVLSLMHLLGHAIAREVWDLIAGRRPPVENDDVLELLRSVMGEVDPDDLPERILEWDAVIRRLEE